MAYVSWLSLSVDRQISSGLNGRIESFGVHGGKSLLST